MADPLSAIIKLLLFRLDRFVLVCIDAAYAAGELFALGNFTDEHHLT